MMNQILLTFRKRAGLTQEQLSEKIGVSRQAVANWEKGDTVPDIPNCIALADLYQVTVDDLVGRSGAPAGMVPPKGKYFFGSLTVGTRGQIVIPKKARDTFHIQDGDQLILLGDEERGLALLPANMIKGFWEMIEANVFTKRESDQ